MALHGEQLPGASALGGVATGQIPAHLLGAAEAFDELPPSVDEQLDAAVAAAAAAATAAAATSIKKAQRGEGGDAQQRHMQLPGASQ